MSHAFLLDFDVVRGRLVLSTRKVHWTRAAFACITSMTMHAACAAALQVSPIRLDLTADTPAAVLTLHNEGATPLNAQVRVFAWTQSLDDDHLDPTDAVIASPPIVRLAPNGEQTVRILRVAREPLAREETYRLLVDEIPAVAQAAHNDGVRMQLRYSVPVFARAQQSASGASSASGAPAISFALERDADALMLRASNATDAHAQLSRVSIEWPDGRSSPVSDGLLGYALPHATRRWPVPDAPTDATLATVHAIVDGEPVTARVVIGAKAGSSR